ncbi:glycine zipper family protein [Shewanella sp.]|uniref:glycine zipper family protein n=1 Tax=Shewanella sp. TaxID=50422 RepID=UPI00356452C2
MRSILSATALFLFTNIAHANIIVDRNGVDEKEYLYDMHQCTELSNQVQQQQASGGMVSGAVKGAAVGAAAGAISGGSGSDGAKMGAGIGVTGGFLKRNAEKQQNANAAADEKKMVLRNCMTGRGYRVLN